MRKPFDLLGERLLAAGFSPRAVRRYLAELDDHLDDLRAEARRAGQDRHAVETLALSRLGSIEDLAHAMQARPELRSWVARAPWAAFVLAPAVALPAVMALTIAITGLFVEAHRPAADAPPSLPGWFAPLATGLYGFDNLIVPILLGWGIARAAVRHRSRLFWPMIGALVIAVAGAASNISIEFPHGPGTHGEISFGMYLHGGGIYRVLANLVLIGLPLLALQHRRRDPIMVENASQ
jgi:hypothetical protein